MNATQRQSYSRNVKATILRMHPVGAMLSRIREATEDLPKAMLFELRDLGYESLFEQICACVISIRTFDEVSLPAALHLFEQARTPEELTRLSEEQVYNLIRPSSFGREKAKALKAIAEITLEQFNGELPADYDALSELPGLGPRSANLVLGIGGNIPTLGADIHVHRVTNRWGYLNTKNSEHTLLELARKLPKKYWTEMNELLVPFGKHICQGRRPKCSICPVFQYCERKGVRNSL
jgi:endonuclease III